MVYKRAQVESFEFCSRECREAENEFYCRVMCLKKVQGATSLMLRKVWES